MTEISYKDEIVKETVNEIMSILPEQGQEMSYHPAVMVRLLTDTLLRYRAKVEKQIIPTAVTIYSSAAAIERVQQDAAAMSEQLQKIFRNYRVQNS